MLLDILVVGFLQKLYWTTLRTQRDQSDGRAYFAEVGRFRFQSGYPDQINAGEHRGRKPRLAF